MFVPSTAAPPPAAASFQRGRVPPACPPHSSAEITILSCPFLVCRRLLGQLSVSFLPSAHFLHSPWSCPLQSLFQHYYTAFPCQFGNIRSTFAEIKIKLPFIWATLSSSLPRSVLSFRSGPVLSTTTQTATLWNPLCLTGRKIPPDHSLLSQIKLHNGFSHSWNCYPFILIAVWVAWVGFVSNHHHHHTRRRVSPSTPWSNPRA